MSANVAKNKNVSWYVNSAIVCLFVFGFGLLPAISPITPVGMKIMGIFIGVIWGWSSVGMIWPSLLGLIALSFTEITNMTQLLSIGFGTDVFPFMIIMFTVMKLIDSNGVASWIANKIMLLSFLKGRPWTLIFVIFLGSYIVSGLAGGPFVAAIMFWSIFYGIFEATGYKAYEKFPTLMVIGTMLSSCLALVILPFKGNSIVLVQTFTTLSGLSIDFVKYECLVIPMSILMILTYVLVCRFVFRADVSALKQFDITTSGFVDESALKLTKKQKVSLGVLLAVLVIMMAPSFLPAEWKLAQALTGLGLTGRFAVIAVIICIIRIDGEPLLDFSKVASNAVMWDAMFLAAFIIPISSFLTADATGIKPFLTQVLSPILAGRPMFVFTALLLLLAAILTNVANNGVIAIILMSVVMSFMDQMSIDPTGICVLLMLTVQIALVTPAASPFAAILFGNKAWIRAKDVYLYGTISILICTGVMILVGYFWMNIIF